MEISVPKLSLVLLIGASGSGKSTFARKLFSPFEVVSSDECRGMVSNDVNDLSATNEAFDLLYHIVRIRLTKGLLTVVDATNVRREDRKKLVEIAREHHALPVAIALDLPQKVCEERNEKREDRTIPVQAIRRHRQLLRKGLRGLKREGFRKIYVFSSEEEIDQIEGVKREKLYNDKQEISGPFDIIGDIHGCYDETLALLDKLGYKIEKTADEELFGIKVSHPENRQVIFLGDLVDRGPNSPAVLRLAISMVKSGLAWCVPGNHDVKLHKKLSGKNVRVQHGLEKTLEQLEGESEEFLLQTKEFIYSLISHYVFDEGKLVVSHAGLKESMIGRASGAVRSFCLYGETTGEIDEFGLPVRHNWASEYRGKTMVVYGHTPVPEAEWLNNTIDIDTGCVFGGKLTALRYPEKELVSINAKEIYSEPVRPLQTEESSHSTAQQEHDDVLDIADFL
ncbi:MAG: AAA family ATPase, partial [Bacteroidota bacterium]